MNSDKTRADIEQDAISRHGLNGSASTQWTPRPSRIANPGALGLFSFASTTFMLSMYNVHARGIKTPNTVVGMAIFGGGLVQLLAGMWEFPRGNVFGATAFSSYGAFWLSYAAILIPGTGISSAYSTTSLEEFASSIGIYLITWMMVTFFFFVAALRKSIAFIALFSFLTLTFLILACGEFVGASDLAGGAATIGSASYNLTRAGGALGIITAFIAYYIALSELLASDTVGESWRQGALPLGGFAAKKQV